MAATARPLTHLHGDQEAPHPQPIGQPAHRNGGRDGAEKEERGQRADLLATEVEGVAQEWGEGPHAVHHEQDDKLRSDSPGRGSHGGPGCRPWPDPSGVLLRDSSPLTRRPAAKWPFERHRNPPRGGQERPPLP